MLKTGTRLLCFSILFFGASFSYSNAQVELYSNTATTSANTTNKVEIPINCLFVNGDISRVDLFYQKRSGLSATTTLSINGSVLFTAPIVAGNATYQWYEHQLTSSFPCSSGYATITLESSLTGSNNRFFVIRGSSATTSVQYTNTKYSYPVTPTISYTPTSTAIILYSDGTPPPPPPHPLPPPISGALITRIATTTCVGSSTSSTCSTAYIPEFYYLDWIFVNMIQIFLLSFMVIGYFMNRTLRN